MTRWTAGLSLALAGLAAGRAAAQPDSGVRRPFSFAVLGHIRGDRDHKLNPKLGELLDHVRALHPDFVVLTGDPGTRPDRGTGGRAARGRSCPRPPAPTGP